MRQTNMRKQEIKTLVERILDLEGHIDSAWGMDRDEQVDDMQTMIKMLKGTLRREVGILKYIWFVLDVTSFYKHYERD